MFLAGLDSVACAMRLDAAPRAYRIGFTINYRALFPDDARNYRVDVLEASVEQHAVIWVNGDNFSFSPEAMRRAEALQQSCVDLKTCLGRWAQAVDKSRKPSRNELEHALMAVDKAWANFEHKYITELISIEEKARQLIVDAIQHEQRLTHLEQLLGDGKGTSDCKDSAKQEIAKLVGCIAKLNSIANVRRKGRDDLAAEILFAAQRAMKRCTKGDQESFESEADAAARILATDVVESFEAMRNYLREVNKCLERVDPHLCNNAGLVARLVDWEESWEIGAKYVQHEPLLHAVCDVVATVRGAQKLAPALVDMCNDCDVELFMVLPRIIWLRFLVEPTGLSELLKTLLPHRFGGGGDDESKPWDASLAAFIGKFRAFEETVSGGAPPEMVSVNPTVWKTLVKRVVSGESCEKAYGHLSPRTRHVAVPAVEELLHLLEGYSIELQRHCAEDWNQCSAILVQCLSGDDTENQKQDPFSV
jgi:hypothetical protein